MDQIQPFTVPEAFQIGAYLQVGWLLAKGDQTFQAEDGVVEVAAAGAIPNSPVGVDLFPQEVGDPLSGFAQQVGGQPRDLQHFEPQTHCNTPR